MTTRRVGTIGWSHKDWKGSFYPPRTAPADHLRHYVRHFGAVEVDSTFHALPAPSTVQRWAEVAPPGFRFALKVPKAITHERQLEGCAEDLLAFRALVAPLGEHLGPLILQLPPRFGRARLPDLFELLEALPVRPGLSVEFRHPSCFSQEMFEVLRSRAVGLVTTDAHGGLLLSGPDVVLRLMGNREDVSVFDRVVIDRADDLETWATRLEQLPDWVQSAYVFVNNHFSGHSPRTAAELASRLGLSEPPATQREMFG